MNAPDPVTSLATLTVEQVDQAMGVWRERMRAHRNAAYVHVIVNERREAGASLPHTHAQLYALEFVPAAVARERERFRGYATRTMGGNLLADLVQEEVRRRERIVAIDSETVLMAPYGAQVPFQLMIAPRTPRARFEDDGPTGAAMLHDALRRLERRFGTNPPLNLWVRTAPRGAEDFCWRIDIVPRLTHLAGLELGAGVHLNIVPPEQVAGELRDGGLPGGGEHRCGRSSNASPAPRWRSMASSSRPSAPGCSSSSGSAARTPSATPTGWPRRSAT